MIHFIYIIFYSVRWPGEQSGNQRTCHVVDNQRHEIRYGQISLWGHCRRWPEVIWWDCDWPCCKRYVGVCFRSKKSGQYYVLKGKSFLLIHMLNAVRWHHVVSGLWHTDHDVSMTRPTQLRRRVLGYKRKPLKLHMLWIAVLKKASPAYFGGTVPVMQRQKQPYTQSIMNHQVPVWASLWSPPVAALMKMSCVSAVKPVVPKCSVPKSVPFGKSAELSCVEEEGFPKSHYQWFKNREEIPDDPKTSLKFSNSSYTLNSETGTLVSILARAFWTRTCMSSKGGAAGMVAWRPGVGADILGRQLMVREGLSHEGNLLSSFAHSSILSQFPTQLSMPCLSPPTLWQPSGWPRTRDAAKHICRVSTSVCLTPHHRVYIHKLVRVLYCLLLLFLECWLLLNSIWGHCTHQPMPTISITPDCSCFTLNSIWRFC